jgi:aspartyl-tRNA(Asn)/glutamyl-tRNA(Gln) amidotransferase subunit B
VSPEHLNELAVATASGEISSKLAKQVFQEMYDTGKGPEEIIRAKGWMQITDETAIMAMVEKIMAANPGPVAEYRQGKTQTLGFLVGQVMKTSNGQADPKLVNQILRERLG